MGHFIVGSVRLLSEQLGRKMKDHKLALLKDVLRGTPVTKVAFWKLT